MQKFEELQIFMHSVKSSLGPVWNSTLRVYLQQEISNCYMQNGHPPVWASAWGFDRWFTYVQYKDLVKFVKKDEVWYGVALRTLTDTEIRDVEQCTKATLVKNDEKKILPEDITKYFLTTIHNALHTL